MTKIIARGLMGIIVVGLFCIIVLNYYLRFSRSHNRLEKISEDYFQQVNNLIEKNQNELEAALEDFSKASLRRAKTVSYVIEHDPDIENDREELKKLGDILEVDEIHLLDPTGEIIFGTHPEYYHYTFQSGDQMRFFLPMLGDHSMELCQEITPNTAENKLMQYAAVWREDQKGIVQIGLIPERALEIKEENSLNNIVSLIPSERGTELYIISEEDGEILASTDSQNKIKNADEMGLPWREAGAEMGMGHVRFHGEKYCIFFQKNQGMVYIRTYPSVFLARDIFWDTGFTIVYILLLFIVTAIALLYYTNCKVVKGLNRINQDMKAIEKGSKYYVSNAVQIPELRELADAINGMTDSIRSAFKNFSVAVEKSNIPMGLYEYGEASDRYFISDRVWGILKLARTAEGEKDQDRERLCLRIEEMKAQPYDREKNIYSFQTEEGVSYVHIEEFEYERRKVLLFVDVTDEYSEKEKILLERDRDYLTNLYTRRAFMEQMKALFQSDEGLKNAAVLMIDADGLKQVNDQRGHALGDQYLNQIAKLISKEVSDKSVCARLGGDEFAVLLYGYTSEEKLAEAIRHIESRESNSYMKTEDGEMIPLRYSMGYAVYKKDGEDYHALLKCADERMYFIKEKRHRQRRESFTASSSQ